MKTLIAPLNLLFLLVLATFHPLLYSQEQTDISKLIVGGTYKIVLYDDTEITGKIQAVDSANIVVEMAGKNVMIVPKNNILYFSSNLTPSKYASSFSLLAGVSLLTEDNYNTYYYSGDKRNSIAPNFNLSGTFYLSDVKAVKIDFGFTHIKAKTDGVSYAYYTEYPTTFAGGNIGLYSMKGNYLFGRFDPKERFMFYGSVGLGIHYTSQDAITETYWTQNYPDTNHVQRTTYIEAQGYFNLLLSGGASAGYRFSKHFGGKIELEYNLVTSEHGFFIFGGRNYFPLRAGIFYIF